MRSDLQPGLTFEWQYTVPPRATVPNLYHDTAICRDMPDVLATGYMVGLLELACLNGILPYIDWPDEQSVGTHVDFSHLAATPAGMTVTIKGELIEIDGRRLKFRVEAWDGIDKIAEGMHERVVINPERFNDRLVQKKAQAGL